MSLYINKLLSYLLTDRNPVWYKDLNFAVLDKKCSIKTGI